MIFNYDELFKVQIIIGETANVYTDDLPGLRLYLRNKHEAGINGTDCKHDASFKVVKGNKMLADVFISKNNKDVIIKGKKNLNPAQITFVTNFAIKNKGNLDALWDTDRSSKNYKNIIKRIQRNNKNCNIVVNKD